MIGVLIVTTGFLFQMITQTMSNQAQPSWGGIFGGFPNMFPTIQTDNVFGPFIGMGIWLGIFLIVIGCGIFIYGRLHRKNL